MEATEEIKSRLDIVDLVGEYLTLKSAGSGAFKAVCPFHQERTPSFYVSRTRQSWHCFGCNEGGDHFSFIEKIEGMDFREALVLLAQKTGTTLPTFNKEQASVKERLVEVNELATRFFRTTLRAAPDAQTARDYLERRGLDQLTIDLFKIGFAPDAWTGLTDALGKQGVTSDELLRAGLALKRERGDGVYDRFRGRIMFPIADVHGKIVGFTGRILSNDKKEAKYVNTPETSLYRKSAVLYGLDRAKGEIRQKDQVVLVEGNMDVVGSHQFGVNNVVACSGTALTNEQLMLIKRFTNNIAIAFDQDAAGNAATLRGLDLARAQDFSITIITLPPEAGKDPDDAVRKDPEIWRQAIKDAVNIMEWIYRRAFKAHEIHTPEGKKLVARDLLPEIARMKDAVERDGWIKKLARDLVVGEGALLEAMKGIVPPRPSAPASSFAQVASPTSKPAPKRFFSTDEEREHQLLCLMMSRVELFAIAMDEIHWQAEEFASPLVAGLYKKLVFGYAEAKLNDGHPPADSSPEEISLYNALAFEAERDLGEETLESLTRDLAYLTDVLRAKRTTDARKILEQAMREAEQRGDIERIAELVKRFNALQ